jgi:hypothetical protein
VSDSPLHAASLLEPDDFIFDLTLAVMHDESFRELEKESIGHQLERLSLNPLDKPKELVKKRSVCKEDGEKVSETRTIQKVLKTMDVEMSDQERARATLPYLASRP